MNEYNVFYYRYSSVTNAQLPLLRVAARYFDKPIILDSVSVSSTTIGAVTMGGMMRSGTIENECEHN